MQQAARERLEAAIREIEDRMARSVFHEWAQISLVRVEDGEVEIELDTQEHHLNLLGILHGGMIATLADTAMGLAVRTRHRPGNSHVTGSLTVNYLAPGKAGPVRAIGRAVKAGRQTGYGEADVRDGEGRLLARASATFIVLRARPEREGTPPS
ncbi:MAG: PaaI family thioesterase [Actinomycetota bacterium]